MTGTIFNVAPVRGEVPNSAILESATIPILA